MLTDEEKAAIAQDVARQMEGRSGAARIVFEMVVEAISQAAERDFRPLFRDSLMEVTGSLREQSEQKGSMSDLIADELETYVQRLEGEGMEPGDDVDAQRPS